MQKIKKGDTVRVIAGKDKGREGTVLAVYAKENRVLVEGVNMVSKHTKPSASNQAGGIIEHEAPIHISNVMYLADGVPTRIGFTFVDGKDGKPVKKRVAKKTGKVID